MNSLLYKDLNAMERGEAIFRSRNQAPAGTCVLTHLFLTGGFIKKPYNYLLEGSAILVLWLFGLRVLRVVSWCWVAQN